MRQWCALLLNTSEHAGDAAEFRAETGLDHDATPAPTSNVGTGIEQVDAVSDGEFGIDQRLVLAHGHRLTGERRLVYPQIRHLCQSGIRGHPVAGRQQHLAEECRQGHRGRIAALKP